MTKFIKSDLFRNFSLGFSVGLGFILFQNAEAGAKLAGILGSLNVA